MEDYVGALEWCFQYHYHRDCSNAAIHLGSVKFSPITFRLAMALDAAVSVEHAREIQHVLDAMGTYPLDEGR